MGPVNMESRIRLPFPVRLNLSTNVTTYRQVGYTRDLGVQLALAQLISCAVWVFDVQQRSNHGEVCYPCISYRIGCRLCSRFHW